MSRLQLYTHPDGSTTLHESGFSWLAAFALPVWALQRHLRWLAAAGFVLALLPNMVCLLLDLPLAMALPMSGLYFLACGSLAPRMHARWLRRQGWVVTAEEPDPAPRRAT